MKIIVVGCGKIGSSIALQLAMEGHEISVIDTNEEVINEITDNVDVVGLVGNGVGYGILKKAGVLDADLLIAATSSDELNLLCCLVARRAGGCNTIARVRNPIYNSEIGFIREELGLSMSINPEYAAAVEAARILRFPSAIQIETFARGKVEILKFVIPGRSVLDGCHLYDIGKKTGTEVLVCAVERGNGVTIPDGSFILKSGDTISIVASPDNGREFIAKAGVEARSVRDCMIIGGGKIAYYLAKQLIRIGIRVKIIERDRERCEELCDLLPSATIINADATNEGVLHEEGIEDCDSFVTLTGIDEENLFLSLYATHCSKAKIITKINRLQFDEIVGEFHVGSIISPKSITADHVLRFVRAMQNSIGTNVESLYNIIENRIEALEFHIRDDGPVVGTPLANLPIKDNVLVACIMREGRTILPNGQTRILIGDYVIIVTSRLGFQDISDILEKDEEEKE